MILRIDHELLEAQERRIYFCFFKNQNDEEEKNYFIIKNEMKKVTFLYVRLWMNKKKISCYLLWPLFEIKLADKYNDDEYD